MQEVPVVPEVTLTSGSTESDWNRERLGDYVFAR
jgi:D-tyrosyl-tRNA(Tyr) deacylase